MYFILPDTSNMSFGHNQFFMKPMHRMKLHSDNILNRNNLSDSALESNLAFEFAIAIIKYIMVMLRNNFILSAKK